MAYEAHGNILLNQGPLPGTAAIPDILFLNSSISGFFLKADSTIGVAVGGTEVFNFGPGGGSEVGQLILADGTAAAPSLAFGGASSNTGLFLKAADSIGISLNGTERASFASTGALTLTIGTIISATTNQLVLGSTNTTTISSTAPSASRVYTIPDAGGSANFLLSAGNQTSTGIQTFSALPVFSVGISTPRVNVASTATIASLASTNSYVKLTGSTATDLQGIAAGVNGQRLVLANLTGQNLTIRNQSASAASGAKITNLTGADIVTTGNGAAEFIYDTDASPAEWTCIWTTA